MPSNVTPTLGLSDHIHDVRSHTGPGAGGQMVTNESLRGGRVRGVLGARVLLATNFSITTR